MDKKCSSSDLLIKGYRFTASKREVEEKSKSQPEKSIPERVKLKRQKAYDKELFSTSSNFTDENNDEFIDIPEMAPLEGDEEEVEERKELKILTPNKLLTLLPILTIKKKHKKSWK